jgi:hypothetical protein
VRCAERCVVFGEMGEVMVKGLMRTAQCKSAQSAATVRDFTTAVASTNIGPDPNFPDFDLICEG